MPEKIPIRQLTSTDQPLFSQRFKIRRLEEIVGENGMIHELHRHGFFFVLAISAGEGVHEIDFIPFNIAAGSVFFLRPGQVHKLELSSRSKGYLLEFSPDFYAPVDKNAAQRLSRTSHKNYCAMGGDRFSSLLEKLEMLLVEATRKEVGFEAAICNGLDLLLIEVLRASNNKDGDGFGGAGSYGQERFEEFTVLLSSSISRLKQVADYTALMNLSAYQLNKVCKTAVGKTASELINEQILLEARRYLLATTAQVKEIAEQLGYLDHSYFIRFFKKDMGVSPEAYRRNFS